VPSEHNLSVPTAPTLVETLPLEPDPVVEAYKRDVDLTLVRENLKLTVEERVTKMMRALRLAEEVRNSRRFSR
jgi:hypothetical protein